MSNRLSNPVIYGRCKRTVADMNSGDTLLN